MSQYNIDFEIIYTIKEGHHNFNEIWSKVKGIGSKQTFSKHLSQLVDEGVIFKESKDSKTRYELGGDTSVFDTSYDTVNELEKEISTLKEKTKKISKKKLLKQFIKDTEEDIKELSEIRFAILLLQRDFEMGGNDHVKPYIGLHSKEIELIERLIWIRMDILQERDQELYEIFFQCFT